MQLFPEHVTCVDVCSLWWPVQQEDLDKAQVGNNFLEVAVGNVQKNLQNLQDLETCSLQ